MNDIRWEISDSATKVLGSLDTIAKDNGARIEAGFEQLSGDLNTVNESLGDVNESLGSIDDTLRVGFVTLHFDLGEVRESLVEMGAKFEWGFNELAMRLGHIGDTLSELLHVAKTPEQTWAYEQLAIAHDAYRKRLYDDAIDYAQRAITGYQSHTGYRLDHRPHHLLGLIYLGDRKSAPSHIVNTETAERHLLDAARYAEADYPKDAAHALTEASFAAYDQSAYDQGAMDRAETYATRAISVCGGLVPEAHFQLATVKMSVGKVDSGLHHLRDAIEMDRLYVVKAWTKDSDFMRHEAALVAFTDRLRDEKAAIIKAKASTLADVSRKIGNEARKVLVTLPDLVGAGRASSLSAVQTIEAQIAVFQEAITVAANPTGLLDTLAAGYALEAARSRLNENISQAISAIQNSLTDQPVVVEKLARRYLPPIRYLPPKRSLPYFPVPDDDDGNIGHLAAVVIVILFIGWRVSEGVSKGGAVQIIDGILSGIVVGIILFFIVNFLCVWIVSLIVFLLRMIVFFLRMGWHSLEQKRLNNAHVAAINQDLADEKAFNAEREALLAQLSQLHSVLQSLVNCIREHAKRADVAV